VGVCGDWLTAPSLEAAACSGIALAEHIGRHNEAKRGGGRAGSDEMGMDVGLDCGFKPVEGPGASAIVQMRGPPAMPAGAAAGGTD
jgi:hypothetical protein